MQKSTCLNSDPHASDDDDSWLSLHPDELDELMRKASSVLADAPQPPEFPLATAHLRQS
ncbi:hypothetical protein GGH99_001417 [Coemansia sp. RSA 1285]|nr:hypothetical protein GGH99_001417 [Coemansia sp. RSA 1285]